MNDLAIALCRVSTPQQRLSGSLNRQEESVLRAAQELGVAIDRWWSGDVSSKAGTNVKRKDLKQMIEHCKHNKRIKFLIVDEPDRFMRSIDEAFYFEVTFRELGVKVWYACDPQLNTDDLTAKMLKFSKYLPAEGSNLERQRKSIVGHEKALRDGRYTFQPKPGYMKGTEPGVHVPHPHTFTPLQKAFREVISGLYTPTEALRRLNQDKGFRSVYTKWRMDKFRHHGASPYYAQILAVNKQVKAENSKGRHQPMLSVDEHEILVKRLNGGLVLRGHKKQYNPEFPMNKILLCSDCEGEVKFTGSRKNNGYERKTTKFYFKYNCRGCGRGYHRDEVHEAITNALGNLEYNGSQRKELLGALEVVWEQKNQDKLDVVKALDKRRQDLVEVKRSLVLRLARSSDELSTDIEDAITSTKEDIKSISQEISQLEEQSEDLIDFLRFALDYTDGLRHDWWEMSFEDKVQCQQLLFPGGIRFGSSRKVGTSEISPIYRLRPNKKDLSKVEKSLMVELPGTAPGSVSLSLLVVYRLSLLKWS